LYSYLSPRPRLQLRLKNSFPKPAGPQQNIQGNSLIGYPTRMTEDETFKALKRDPFKSVVDRILIYRTRYPLVEHIMLYTDVVNGRETKHHSWDSVAGGWTFEDFKEECEKKLNEYTRQQEGRMGLHDSGRDVD
jgi:hypothetical protein